MIENKTIQNIITIDGPSGSGKSTVAHLLAKKLDWIHINTGAIYRTFAWCVLNKSLSINDIESDPREFEGIALEIAKHYIQDDDQHQFFLNGQNITKEIYTPEISNLSSTYAKNKSVRHILLPIQRKIATQYTGVVLDGRDMGTIVFPFAPLKIFLTADIEIRAKRRTTELQEKGIHVNFDSVLTEMHERDLRDTARDIAPSKPAQDAIIIDSSEYSIDEVVNKIFLLYRRLQDSKVC